MKSCNLSVHVHSGRRLGSCPAVRSACERCHQPIPHGLERQKMDLDPTVPGYTGEGQFGPLTTLKARLDQLSFDHLTSLAPGWWISPARLLGEIDSTIPRVRGFYLALENRTAGQYQVVADPYLKLGILLSFQTLQTDCWCSKPTMRELYRTIFPTWATLSQAHKIRFRDKLRSHLDAAEVLLRLWSCSAGMLMTVVPQTTDEEFVGAGLCLHGLLMSSGSRLFRRHPRGHGLVRGFSSSPCGTRL